MYVVLLKVMNHKKIWKKLNIFIIRRTLNILIDEPTTDAFSFYGDRRNNIHLLLYFNEYNSKYDILPGDLPLMLEALQLKIPIIFLVNKCPNDAFDDEDSLNDLKEDVVNALEGTGFENFNTYRSVIFFLKKKIL